MTADRVFGDRSRTDQDAARYAEPTWKYLNRSARPEIANVRDLIESWFGAYPDKHKPELGSRLRSRDDGSFHAAFFELYLHSLLKELRYRVDIHPKTTADTPTRPDFLVTTEDQRCFYLECTLANNLSRKDEANLKLLNQAYDSLNGMNSPDFFIHLEVSGRPKTSVSGRKLRTSVEQFLAGLDADECAAQIEAGGLRAVPSGAFHHEGCTLTYSPIPKRKEARGKPGVRPLGMHGGEAQYVDNRSALRKAIEKKGGKYGDLGMPLVVAVNAINQSLSEADIADALFGQEQFMLSKAEPVRVVGTTRALDGAWAKRSGPSNTRVSAALVVSMLVPSSVAWALPIVYHNPWAKYPDQKMLRALRSVLPQNGDLITAEGTAAPLFSLPAGWPR